MRLESLSGDLRLAARSLLRARGFAATAVLTLALGLSGAAVMFTVVRGVLLRPLPVHEPERLLLAWKELRSRGFTRYPMRVDEIDVVRDGSRVLESVAGLSYYDDPTPMAAGERERASPVEVAAVTGGFFHVLGTPPLLGRGLKHADDVTGAEPVLVISHRLWQRRFLGSPDVVGRRLVVGLGGRPFTIVGVMPPRAELPHRVEAWMTLAAAASLVTNPAFSAGVRRDVVLVARLRPGATLEQARQELSALWPRLDARAPPSAPRGSTPHVQRYEDVVVGGVRPALLLLFGVVALVLLVACANVANLLLLRGIARRPELALRAVLGASPGRVARQLFTESLLLALVASALALAFTSFTLRALLALVPGGLPRVESVRLDGGVLLFVVVVAAVTAVLAGLVPAIALARADLAARLGAGGKGPVEGAGTGRRLLVWRRWPSP